VEHRAARDGRDSWRVASAESIVPLYGSFLPDAGVVVVAAGMRRKTQSLVEGERARVDRHADDRVDAEGVEGVDLFARRDAAGGGELSLRRLGTA
jgi:hypothetical protein